jgi:predicted lipoprotein
MPLRLAFALSLGLLGGCKVIAIEADREARERSSEAFNAQAYVNRSWSTRIVPELKARSVPLAALQKAMRADLDRAGQAHGRRAAEGSPWSFVVSGDAVVAGVNHKSRAGRIDLIVQGADRGVPVSIEAGPVMVNTALRDCLPFLTFDDFADQIAFADVGRELNRRALTANRTLLDGLAPGDRVRFLAAANIADADAPIKMTAITLQRSQPGSV